MAFLPPQTHQAQAAAHRQQPAHGGTGGAVLRRAVPHPHIDILREIRRIVLLHAVTGMKHREIAALLELPLPTVLSKYHRALKKMRSCLEGDDAR